MTDWKDIGSICRTFGNEREAITAIYSGRITPGRNFWKEAADEIERLRAQERDYRNLTRSLLDMGGGDAVGTAPNHD